MGLQAKTSIHGIPIQRVFIGSCTNAIKDPLLQVYERAPCVLGCQCDGRARSTGKKQAEEEGLDRVFKEPDSTGGSRLQHARHEPHNRAGRTLCKHQ